MLVTFTSSETGELLMFAAVAKTLLQAVGKETTARGVFTQGEMAVAATALRQAVARAEAAPTAADEAEEGDKDEKDEEERRKEPVITLGQRAWPLIDMLERTAKRGPEANIVWQAKADF